MNTTKAIFGVLKITSGLTGRVCTSWLAPLLLLLLLLPAFGAQAAVCFSSLYSFTGGSDGANPFAGLVQGSDGSFYGTTENGGTHGNGTVFRISPTGALTSLYSFTGGADGANPLAGLAQGRDGYFYGTTESGCTNDCWGTVFKINTNGILTTLYSFGWDDGAYPNGLVQGSDGGFYGTTSSGGANLGFGTAFTISTNGEFTRLHSFGSVDTNGVVLDGAAPNGLAQGGDGNFYGTTAYAGEGPYGPSGNGTIFRISTNGAFATLYSFTDHTNGAIPQAGLLAQGSDGYSYGATEYSGGFFWVFAQWRGWRFYGDGTVFKISANGALTTLYSFGSVLGNSNSVNPLALDGSGPNGLVQGRDGGFYGTTSSGGTYNNGTIFRLTIVPAPQLNIIPSSPYMILAWPTNYAGFTLQSTTDLGSSAVWTTVFPGPVVIGGQNVVINTISGTQRFYRLSQ